MNDDLLVKYLAGEADMQERLRVEEWLGKNEKNALYYSQLERIWNESENLALHNSPDEQAAWERFRHRVKQQEETGQQQEKAWLRWNESTRERKTLRTLREEVSTPTEKIRSLRPAGSAPRWLKAAAALALLISAGWLARYLLQENRFPAMVELASEQQVREEMLPDGSLVTLNKNSLISFPRKFRGTDRLVSLEGEAFFNVEPDKSKPFIISVNDLKVEVTGTSFNVKSRNGVTEVIVETGSVHVSRGSSRIDLRPGEKAVSSNENEELVKQHTGGALYKYYRTNKFVCRATPLQELINTLNEAYGVHIVIPDKSLQRLTITTEFDNESLERILEVIADTFDITVQYEEKQIILKR
ncbi:FecR family protein [Anseongella ginsenosidimutans]|uniref:FecR family protein n=1 Tax=Anseongella ginsenosidimutans TaxID=496056 RepID=A0A4R3L0W5_9SPHI|nr:FecR domain-containing protein [Anseongella ginsenosidimutans]QEC51271.1 DUF4974 domain-containing protein [Anseongella ginsenosidimutans]TCS90042.1 FecR family protein [Anseongella ginsenosidimutans]